MATLPRSIRDLELSSRRVFLRVDFNVPQDKATGAITNNARIVAALPTIKYALEQGASGPAGAFTLDDSPGIWVVPKPAPGIKCRRSWKYFDPASATPGFPDITPRDALAVKAWDKVAG